MLNPGPDKIGKNFKHDGDSNMKKRGDHSLAQHPVSGNLANKEINKWNSIRACKSHLMCPKDWAQHAGLQAPDKPCSSQTQWGHKSGCGGLENGVRKHSDHTFTIQYCSFPSYMNSNGTYGLSDTLILTPIFFLSFLYVTYWSGFVITVYEPIFVP